MSQEEQLLNALADIEQLRIENQQLREKLGLSSLSVTQLPVSSLTPIPPKVENLPDDVHNLSPVEAKIALFKSFFRGRNDVYAIRWQSKLGNTGYSSV